jgi:hypothetical protein
MASTFAPIASDTASTRCGGATAGAAEVLALSPLPLVAHPASNSKAGNT